MNELRAVVSPGLTLTVSLFDGSTLAASGVAMSEVSPGYYVADMPNTVSAGRFTVLVYDGAEIVATGEIQWDGTAELSIQPISTQVRELHLIHGLLPGSPLTVADGSRTAGYVSQTITDSGTETVVQRL